MTVLVFGANFCFADTTSTTSYDDINFPQWAKDLRRTEIITFGSLPFVTLWTSMGYGLAVQGTFHNPLDKSSSDYSESEQKQIIAIAAAASVGLGLTDLIINLIVRSLKKSRQNKIQKTILVVPFSEQQKMLSESGAENPPEPENLPPPPPEEEQTEEPQIETKDYLIRGLENAIF